MVAAILLLLPSKLLSQSMSLPFHRIKADATATSSQVNCIMSDSRGYIWVGTQYGMARYDGFSFSTLLHVDGLTTSLPNNMVDDIQEDRNGRLWVHTMQGYCVYDNYSETFDTDLHDYIGNYHIQGTPDKIYIDDEKNLWITVVGKGLYRIDAKNSKTTFKSFGKEYHSSKITWLLRNGRQIIVNFDDGMIKALDANTLQQRWQTDFVKKQNYGSINNYKTYIDDRGDVWVSGNHGVFVYGSGKKKWYTNVRDFFGELGYKLPFNDEMLIKDVTSDRSHHLWIATEHLGLLMFSHKDLSARQFLYNRLDPNSIPDNTIQCLYVDKEGGLWIGSIKNGIAYYSPSEIKFETIALGDICSITQDRNGTLWCTSNDAGIITYDPRTKDTRTISDKESGLGSNTVVCSMTADDGSLWFGTYNGGMARYKDGSWKVWRAGNGSGLLNDNVWALTQLPDGTVAIGTLGSGVQLYDPRADKFTDTYNTKNSKILSDYISSMTVSHDGRLIISHSEGLAFIDLKTRNIENVRGNHAGVAFSSQLINQVFEDSRGIIWCATLSGINAYNPKTDNLVTINNLVSIPGSVACGVTEDRSGQIWVVNEHSVSAITVSGDGKGKFSYFATAFNSLDGLQERPFNYRSIHLLSNGDIAVGGQDGINIIPPRTVGKRKSNARVLFSGLVLFDHPLRVGEEYNGRIILNGNLDVSRSISLKHRENAFTIILASSEISVPQKARFRYRLKGFSDKWAITPEDQNSITFTNLAPGNYTLEAQVINRDGSIGTEISQLKVHISPPIYLSIWAIILYIIIIGTAIWYWRRYILRRQKAKFEVEQYQKELKRTREIEEMKLNFFTNVSHELRTPLMLIISPIQALLNKENDESKKKILDMIYRNAQRLLEMVGQILDFRKMEKNRQTLNLITGDIAGYVRNITDSFQSFGGKGIHLEYHSPIESFNMAFDSDKVRKIIGNLLSNAMKYTQDGGRVDVTLNILPKEDGNDKDMLQITVADNGPGISDEDKKHIFERFYMAHNVESPYGGTGVGLNLAHDFAILHGGDITVADNKGGGTVFTVTLPIRHDPSLPMMGQQSHQQKGSTATTTEDIAPVVSVETGNKGTGVKAQGDTVAKEKEGERIPEILLVDDSTDFLDFMKEELGQRYRVRTAENGKQALDKISEHKPDLILSDVMMPVMDGNEFCRAVKENKHTADIPFIMLTARLAQEHQIEGLANGADEYITKPFNLDVLYMRIKNLLKWHDSAPATDAGKLQPELKHVEITSLDRQLVDKATQYVDDNIRDSSISVESMAKALGMSRVQLYKRLLPVTGSTPIEFIRQIRLRRAEQLLRESQLTVSEVAYSVGFNNPRYFSKYFKEMYGVMPSQYKK